MPDRPAQPLAASPSAPAAEAAIDRLQGMADDVRGCAILDPEGAVLAASGPRERWGLAASGLLAAADAAAGEPATEVHVATEEGEAFAVRERGFAIVAAAERFTLASLMLTDMRAVLRGVVRSAPAAEASAARSVARDEA
ncbi:MAG TPA: hypothetical protein VK919_02770 [Solirubrobacterales bacterium]|nr:hypothetical protein [Solirubrobacterales bacterium]